ncbi:MAG TPA: ABC transporter permease [Chloroflexia bacterium]|nr:ABC transporter permease [Chloroflexia bacterium]
MRLAHITALATRIVQQFRRDPRTLALLFVAPVLILALLGYLLRSQATDTVTLGVRNLDQPSGPLGISAADRLIDQLPASDHLHVVRLSGDADAVRAAVRAGTVDAALIFSPTFTADLLARRPVSLVLVLEGSNPSQTTALLPAVQGALLPAMARAAAGLPGGGGAPLGAGTGLQVTPELLYGSTSLTAIDYFAPVLIGFFAFFLIFLLTCVSFLRERTLGTMERLAASPMSRGDIVLGYMLGFGFFALLQSAIIVLFTAYVLQVHYIGNLAWVFLITLLLALGAVNLGIFLSSFARTELQAVQFIPLVIVPQGLLSGLFWPVKDLPGWLQAIAQVLPLTYANRALTDIMIRGKGLGETLPELAVLLGFAALMVGVAALTLRREVA